MFFADATVFALAIPARITFSQVSQFLQAQRIMRPAAMLSIQTAGLNLVLGLLLVLGWPVRGWDGYGFVACPFVTVGCEYLQVAVLVFFFCGYKGMHRECWPEQGLSCSYVTRARVGQFVKIYAPAAIVGASDWWRVAAIGAVGRRCLLTAILLDRL